MYEDFEKDFEVTVGPHGITETLTPEGLERAQAGPMTGYRSVRIRSGSMISPEAEPAPLPADENEVRNQALEASLVRGAQRQRRRVYRLQRRHARHSRRLENLALIGWVGFAILTVAFIYGQLFG